MKEKYMEISQHVRAILSFVEAANMGSFAAAARKLEISPAAVSKNIAGLEKALDIRLMNRTTRKISLTEEGQSFLDQARVALNALDQAVEMVAEKKSDVSGHVRISTSASFGRDYLLPIIPELLARYAALSIETDFDDRVIDLVNDHYDIAIRGGRIIDSSLISRPVCRLDLVLVASPEYLSKYGNPKSPNDLKRHRLIVRKFLGGKASPWEFRTNDGGLITLDPEPATLTLSAPEALVDAACLGIGIAQVGVHNVIEHLKAGKLHVVLCDEHHSGSYEMVLQYPHRSFIASRVRVTIEYLLEKLTQNPTLNIDLKTLDRYKYNEILN